MGRLFRALAWLAAFAVPASAAFYLAYVATGNVFRQRAVPYPFERFGFVVGMAAAFWALGLACLARWIFRLIKKRSPTP